MTAHDRLEHLVRLALEAWDNNRDAPHDREGYCRDGFEAAVRERMAQAAQAWALEVDADALRALDEAQARADALQAALAEMLETIRKQDETIKRLAEGLAAVEVHCQSAVDACRDLWQGRKAGDRG